ncbi:ATP adenylyltransferase-domain-containing protein [Lanmaoa asiatica]|nr:ATP adenylyltransferase-domain-containing protein [Lanmaoa asiatica]
MGNLVWHDLSRFISVIASISAVWASFWGMFFRKFFWDFMGGILRNPGGTQPSPKVHMFIAVIIKLPIVQIVAMVLGFILIALEYPLPTVKGSRIHRSIPLRVVLLILQSFLTVLFYQKFKNASESGEQIHFPSVVYDHQDIGLEVRFLIIICTDAELHLPLPSQFELRLCTALQRKPVDRDAAGQLSLSSESSAVVKKNPFAPPYIPELYIGELSLQDGDDVSHYVVLANKFAVVPHHFLLVTKEFEPQTSPLLPQDLVQTYLLLLAARKANKHFIAFYNCGSKSGASQPHKHIQFIEVGNDGPPIEKLARKKTLEVSGKPFAISSLPYANHVFRLPSLSGDLSVAELSQALFPPFLSLLDLVISTVRHDPDYPPGSPSYNAILTLEHMHLIPRHHEAYKIEETQELISVNSLGFAGMLLAKSESELETMKKEGIGRILRGVGLESVHELQVAGTSLEAP